MKKLVLTGSQYANLCKFRDAQNASMAMPIFINHYFNGRVKLNVRFSPNAKSNDFDDRKNWQGTLLINDEKDLTYISMIV
jgi:hypothetical protein